MDEIDKKVIESADKAFSEFLPLQGEVYFGDGDFVLRNGRYPFLYILKFVDGKIKGVSIDKGGASNLEGTMSTNTLNFTRRYTYSPHDIYFNYAKFEDDNLWLGTFQAKGCQYVGNTHCKLLQKNGRDKKLISLMGIEGALRIINESPHGDMSFR